jgi:hypothetical protein
MDNYNIFTNVALITFITLFIVWAVRYNNLKKKYDALVNEPIPCIYEKTKIKTNEGLKAVEDVVDGDLILQPNGKISKVNKITKKLIPKFEEDTIIISKNDSRLFKFKNTIVTYWHKILLGDEMVLPKDHPEFQELIDSDLKGKAKVYNFLLDDYDDLIITEDSIVLESLRPYFDEHGIEHKPWQE